MRRHSHRFTGRPLSLAVVAVLATTPALALAGPILGPGPSVHGVGAVRPLAAHDTASGEIAPGKLLVQYDAVVDACAHCILAGGGRFADVTGSDSLDRLHAELGVRGARAVFFERHGMRGTAARAALGDRLAAARDRHPARARRGRPLAEAPDLTGFYELALAPGVDPRVAAARYAADPAVRLAEPVAVVRASFTPDDPYFATMGTWGQSYADLWGLHAIDAAAAWDVSTGAGVTIAIVDTGADGAHPDLAGRLWTNLGEIAGNGVDDDGNGYVDDVAGWDFAHDDNDPLDRHGHGTHVAGIAAAAGDNGIGVPGVAWNATVMPVQGLDDDGRGFSTDLAQAILYAAENGADVINNSWGGFGLKTAVYVAMETADVLGAVVVAAAGNDGQRYSKLLWLPAEHPRGLTVGAFDPLGALANFSNFGARQSVAAPGVDVLSLRSAKEGFASSGDVGDAYLRLSGTSMASPHAAGVAALVLADAPALSTAEARWRVELGADQPGAPGYEGLLHNPFFGYGRLSASGALATPPVTTRLTPPAVRDWHAFAADPAPVPIPGAAGSFLFTTLDPVAWSLATPAWLAPASAAGVGAGSLDLALDASGLAPGSFAGDLVLDAPTAADGGAAFAARLHAHADVRAGAPVVVATEGWGTIIGYRPAVAANAVGTLTAWQKGVWPIGVFVSLLDGAGNVTGPTQLTDVGAVNDVSIGSDGHDFLVGWMDFSSDREKLRVARVRADGTLLDDPPITVYTRRDKPCSLLDLVGIDFDGTDYWLGFLDTKFCGANKNDLYVLRVRPDGSFGKRARIAKLKADINAVFGCRDGGCLFAWIDWAPETFDAFGKYIRSAWALPVVGEQAAGTPKKVVTDMFGFTGIASNGTSYLALSQRYFLCAVGDICRTQVIASRISAAGDPLDADAIVVSNVPEAERIYPWPGGVAFDGTDWVASYQVLAVDDSPFDDGSYVFVNRIDAAGTPLGDEFLGLLVDDAGRASESVLAATATSTSVVFEDGRNDPLDDPAYPHPDFTEHRAQRVLAHPPGPAYPDRAIGAIGPLAVAERALLRFRVTAPGLDPAATFAAAGLPAGAVFDPATRIFAWRPRGDAAGSYVVTFSADDGAVVSEDVTIIVGEAVRTLVGRVYENGSPLAGAVFQVRGAGARQRYVTTDVAGEYRVEGGLTPGRGVVLKLANPTKKAYRTEPATIRVEVVAGDLALPDVTATPK